MFSTNSLGMLERSLDAATLRNRTILNNLANQDTPQFKSKQVVFEDLLREELNGSTKGLEAYRTNPKHIPFGKGNGIPLPQITSNAGFIMQNNGNNVDVEYEGNQLAKNQIWYNGLVTMTNEYFAKLHNVIEGGR